jgi:hypothetical protein
MGVEHAERLVLALHVEHEAREHGVFEHIREIAGVVDVAVVHLRPRATPTIIRADATMNCCDGRMICLLALRALQYRKAMNVATPHLGKPRIGHSACPHDCPSTCALDVEIGATASHRPRQGQPDNSYTAGVICAKVARYAERLYHPDRLMKPLVRKGDEGRRRLGRHRLGGGARRRRGKPSSRPSRPTAARRSGPIITPARWAWCSAIPSSACATRNAIPASSIRSAPTRPGPAFPWAPARCADPIRARWRSRTAW